MARGSGYASRDAAGNAAHASARERLAQNPFYVLELRPDCSRAEVERAGQKLLGMLELELSAAQHYASPLGQHRRTPELVRHAMAELRNPDRRLLHELWASLDPKRDDDPNASASTSTGSGTGSGVDSEGEASTDGRASAVDLSPFPALQMLGFGEWRSR